MLMHISGARDRVSLISFPRDSWVEIPGAGTAKINAAFSYGGPPLLIRTVEHLTGVRIDHFGVLDFIGFMKMAEAVGGVDVKIAQKTHDPTYGKRTWPAGTVHLDGAQALEFVRQRHGLPDGDLDRIKRQQAFLEALGSKVMSAGTLLNPFKLNSLLKAVTSSVTFDDTVTAGTLRRLVRSLTKTSLIEYFTAPVASMGTVGEQYVANLDGAKTRILFDAVRRDQVGSYVAGGGVANAVGTVR
jgi:LCP family protein required for cell wall assembly